MYHLKGINEINKIIINAIDVNSEKIYQPYNQLYNAYNSFLKKNSIFENYEFSDKMKFFDFQRLQSILPKFCVRYKHHFTDNSLLLNSRLDSNFFENALKKLNIMDSELFDLSNFLIKIILCNHISSYIDGTTENTIGFSLIDFKDHYNEDDFIELVIHQLTHMILFLDDLSNKYMSDSDKQVAIDVGIKYVFGGTEFPIYVAFHSFLVGIEVLSFRMKFNTLNHPGNYHGTTHRIINGCDKIQAGLKNRLSLFSIRAQSLLMEAFDSLIVIKEMSDSMMRYEK